MAARRETLYSPVTTVTENYVDKDGVAKTVNLSLVTLPPGTVLFRGIRLPRQAKTRDVFRDYLGDPEGDDSVCLSPTHNVFFYPFPTVAFGANAVGVKFKAIQVVVLVHPVTLVTAIGPSKIVRGMGQRYNGTAPFQRCATVATGAIAEQCHPLTPKEVKALTYDNCLHPEYQARSGTRGSIAIADLDTFAPKGKKEATMRDYVKALESRHKGAGVDAVLWAYTDENRNVGFPEISMYPYKTHAGVAPLTRAVPNDKAAELLLTKEAAADNLNYLPIATITRDATIDMVKGFFNYSRLGLAENAYTTAAVDQQPAIEKRMLEFIDRAQVAGLTLPYYGNGKLSFDLRTGFFIMSQMAPTNYKFNIVPLDTESAKKDVREYMVLFRTFNPNKYARMEATSKFPRAFIFNRAPGLKDVFKDATLPMPTDVARATAKAAQIYQQNAKDVAKDKAFYDARDAAETQGGSRNQTRKVSDNPFARAARMGKLLWDQRQ